MGVLRIGNTKSKNLADDISEKVPKSVQLKALIETYPNGKIRGAQFEISSLDGEKGESVQISVDAKRSDFMQCMEFSTHECVGGMPKVRMEGRGMTLKGV